MKCHDERERRRAAAPAAGEVKALQTPPCAMTFSLLSDQDHIMVIILRPTGVSPLHPTGSPLSARVIFPTLAIGYRPLVGT